MVLRFQLGFLAATLATACAAGTCDFLANTDYDGGDFAQAVVSDEQACCDMCAEKAGCFVGIYFDGYCYLKDSGATGPVTNSGRTACKVSSPSPSPTPSPSPSPSPSPTPAPSPSLYACSTDFYFNSSNFKSMGIKGIAMDDNTMSQCPEKMLGMWPNTKSDHLKSIRLYAAWKSYFGEDSLRERAWAQLIQIANQNDAKVLVGVDITSDWNENEQQFQWSLELMQRLGKDHIMGFSFGNEMLYKSDLDSLWSNVTAWVLEKIQALDSAGYGDMKVTSAWSLEIFDELSSKSGRAGNFIATMWQQHPTRWVWTVNLYALFDSGLVPTSSEDCGWKTDVCIGITYVKNIMTVFRERVNYFTGTTDAPVWIGETGWSSPFVASQEYIQPFCPGWGSVDSLKAYYKNILEWDGSVNDGLKGVDHIFYFSDHDSSEYFEAEAFGLAQSCSSNKCKIQSSTQTEHLLV